MPVIRRSNVALDETNSSLRRLTLVNASVGAGYLDMGELIIAPGEKMPLHIHPAHEEAMYVLDGPLNYVLGDERGEAATGDVILAPANVQHEISNPSHEPRRIMFIFPTTNVQRVFL